jgi:AICAR transformylase/IMP cyclohydrolase PurH
VSLHDAIENIDIGGPSMLRSAAKNHDSVTVVVDPLDYAEVAARFPNGGNTTLELRRKLAAKVFARTAAYDGAIAAHLQKEFPRQTPACRFTFDFRAAGAAAALRRKSAPRRRRFTASSTIFPAASRQGTFLQQHSGFDGGGES